MSNALTFQSTTFDVIDRNGQPWVKASQLAAALGYSREDEVARLYRKNADEFTESMTQVIEILDNTDSAFPNLINKTRIFSLRGCHLLAMLARTKIAKAFRVWVLDVLESLNKPVLTPSAAPITPDQQCTLQNMVRAMVDKGGIYAQIWSRFNNHFRIAKYSQLPQSRMSEAVAYLMAFDVAPKALPAPKQKALPPAPQPSYREKCAAITGRMIALRGDLFTVSTEMMHAFRDPFWGPAGVIPENKKPFADAMNYAIQSLYMAVNKDFEAMELLFNAYVEAERMLRE